LASRKCVVIIDDDKEICRSLSSVFRKKGFDVNIANSRKDALHILREECYDVAILDRVYRMARELICLSHYIELNLMQ
jgi:DNA-binding response OmpR family regulator